MYINNTKCIFVKMKKIKHRNFTSKYLLILKQLLLASRDVCRSVRVGVGCVDKNFTAN